MAPTKPTTTTLTAPVAEIDNVIRVAAETDIKVGRHLKIDDEEFRVDASYAGGLNVPVLRGRSGTVQAVHALGAVVTVAPYAELYAGLALTKAQADDLCTRLEVLLNEYVDVAHKAIALDKLHDILARLPVEEPKKVDAQEP